MRIYCDGSSNGHTSAVCITHKTIKNGHNIEVFDEFIHPFDIEALAVLRSLEFLHESTNGQRKTSSHTILTDCKNVVDSIYNGDNSNDTINNIRELHNKRKNVKIIVAWIPREISIAGQYLEKRIKKLKKHGFHGKNLRNISKKMKKIKIGVRHK